MKRIVPILIFILSYCLNSAVLEVCSDCENKKVSKAVELSNRGDTILVKKGHYLESNIMIGKSLTIIGEGNPVIEAKDGERIFFVEADSVTIEGLTLRGVKRSFTEDRAAIRLNNSKNCVIRNNKLEDTFFGIYLAKSKYIEVTGNYIKSEAKEEMNSANAIHAWSSSHLTIKNNIAIKHRDGIYLEFVDDSEIENNHSHNNLRYGLHFMFSNDNKYINNIFENNGAGVAVMYSENIEMYKNKFLDNWGASSFGLLLKEIKDSKIHYNEFKTNTKAIYAESAIRVEIFHNDFESNGWAMEMLGSSEDVEIKYNNFLSNTFNVTTNMNAENRNNYSQNYWSDYSGYDLDKDGIGDVPYRPVKFFSQVLGYTPAAIILLRSFFIELLNFVENIVPVLTPEDLQDEKPLMKKINHDKIQKHT